MRPINPVALTTTYHAALERRDFAALQGMYADDACYVSNGVGTLRGKPAILEAFMRYFASHADHTAMDHEVVQTGPHAARAKWSLQATQAAGGTAINRSGTENIAFDAAGRILDVNVTDD